MQDKPRDLNNSNLDQIEKRLKNRIKQFGVISLILISLGIIVSIYGISAFNLRWDKGLESFGNYASGTVVAFWSLAGVVLIYIAFLGQKLQLLYQREELRLNRIELYETRVVLNEQKEQLEKQNETLIKQNFENTFFQMLHNHNEILYHIDIGNGVDRKNGRDCFEKMYAKYKVIFRENNNKSLSISLDNLVNMTYLTFFAEYKNDLGNYFRNLYNIFKFVNSSPIVDKKFYTNIVRAQLSVFELALLFYNCVSEYGSRKFKPLVEDFQILKNLPKSTLIQLEHIQLYKNLKFEEDER